jgi:hypothetical protein
LAGSWPFGVIVGITFSNACSTIGSGLCLVLFSIMLSAP